MLEIYVVAGCVIASLSILWLDGWAKRKIATVRSRARVYPLSHVKTTDYRRPPYDQHDHEAN